MTKEEILEYVLNTPENTNRAVLSDMLDQLSSNSGSNDIFYIETSTPGGQNPTLTITGKELYEACQQYKSVIIKNYEEANQWYVFYYISQARYSSSAYGIYYTFYIAGNNNEWFEASGDDGIVEFYFDET